MTQINSKIPTAEIFLSQEMDWYDPERDSINTEACIKFAKMHVEAALKYASEVGIKVEKKSVFGKSRKWQHVKEGEEVDLFSYQMKYSQNKEEIRGSYPLDNIK